MAAQASILYLGGLKTLRMETLGVSVRPIAPAGRVDRGSPGHEDRRDRLERVLVFNVFGQALFCRGPPRPFRRQPLQLAVICGHKREYGRRYPVGAPAKPVAPGWAPQP